MPIVKKKTPAKKAGNKVQVDFKAEQKKAAAEQSPGIKKLQAVGEKDYEKERAKQAKDLAANRQEKVERTVAKKVTLEREEADRRKAYDVATESAVSAAVTQVRSDRSSADAKARGKYQAEVLRFETDLRVLTAEPEKS